MRCVTHACSRKFVFLPRLACFRFPYSGSGEGVGYGRWWWLSSENLLVRSETVISGPGEGVWCGFTTEVPRADFGMGKGVRLSKSEAGKVVVILCLNCIVRRKYFIL